MSQAPRAPMVEVHGAAFNNQGAHLMLRTVVSFLRDAYGSDTGICLEPSKEVPLELAGPMRLSLLYPPAEKRRHRRHVVYYPFSKAFGRLAPSVCYEGTPLVRRQEPDAFIDISGYAFGDKWPDGFSRMMLARAKYFHKRGRPVVMLPQMLGPFERPSCRKLFSAIAANTDLIFARDTTSLKAARAAAPNAAGKVFLKPDITILRQPPLLGEAEVAQIVGVDVLIVPNARMLDSAGDQWATIYTDRLEAAAEKVRSLGLKPAVLVHEQKGRDGEIAADLAARFDPALRVLTHHDPEVLKAWIATTKLVIGSRFHSIVAALSKGVPPIVMGWAHKYERLLEDYEVPDQRHQATEPVERLNQLVADSLSDRGHAKLTQRIRDAQDRLGQESEGMWGQVRRVLDASMTVKQAD